jgi:DNA-binding transcriptional MerR regulator
MTYTISEIAEMMNVSTHTLRFYDKEGLLPDVERVNGRRVFSEKDLKWLRVLNCLKNTGMPIKEIRKYIELCRQGDKTLEERYQIILKQKSKIEKQIEFLQYNLKEINYKEWYYQKAIEAGTESIHSENPCGTTMAPDEIPENKEE